MSSEFPILETARLQLREVRASDAPALFAIHSDAPGMRWYGIDPLTRPAQAEQLATVFAGVFTAGVGARWAVVRRGEDELIGTCGLFGWNRIWRASLLGYELAARMQRRGYMREALQAVLDYGFGPMALHRIQAQCHADNLASIGLLNGLAFRFEGVNRELGFWSGAYHDLNCYGLLAQDWAAHRGGT